MKITPLAFDSLGTRSMATFVKTRDCGILIDPGVALSPDRFGLPPHPSEIKRKNEHWAAIKNFAKKSGIMIVTHYHYDHHNPDEPGIYRDKIVLLKDVTENINKSQIERSSYFLEQLDELPGELHFADKNEFHFGNTTIEFSTAFPHGIKTTVGYIIMLCIDDGKQRFIHTSDTLGCCREDHLEFVIGENPGIIFCDGPLNFTLRPAVKNMVRIIQETDVKKFVIDHHLLRDLNWKKRISEVFDAADKKGIEIMTAAEFSGRRNDLLEAKRRELYSKN